MKQPKFSILMANYNGAPYIKTAVGSVLDQIFTDWELVFVDDLSTDNSVDVIRSIQKRNPDRNIKLIRRHRNGGYGKSLRTAAKNATGEVFVIVDSDDAITVDALEVMDSAYKEHPEAGMIYSQFTICNNKLEPVKIGDCGAMPEGMTWLDVINKTPKPRPRVSHLKTFKKTAYNATDGFTRMRRTVDKDIVFKLEQVTKLMFVDKELYLYRKHKRSISRAVGGNQKLFIKAAMDRRMK